MRRSVPLVGWTIVLSPRGIRFPPPDGVPRRSVLAGQPRVEGPLEPAERLVGADEPDHVRRDVAGRIVTHRVLPGVESLEARLLGRLDDLGGLGGGDPPGDVLEPAALLPEPRQDREVVDVETVGEELRELGRLVGGQERIRHHHQPVDGLRQRLAVAVQDVAAPSPAGRPRPCPRPPPSRRTRWGRRPGAAPAGHRRSRGPSRSRRSRTSAGTAANRACCPVGAAGGWDAPDLSLSAPGVLAGTVGVVSTVRPSFRADVPSVSGSSLSARGCRPAPCARSGPGSGRRAWPAAAAGPAAGWPGSRRTRSPSTLPSERRRKTGFAAGTIPRLCACSATRCGSRSTSSSICRVCSRAVSVFACSSRAVAAKEACCIEVLNSSSPMTPPSSTRLTSITNGIRAARVRRRGVRR